ncbi:hypothetical protein MRS44_013952 [Fusarium solani]|uniref:uncharacterized protein n=1 Tax=Fusarium solani TaxID=169388 RepID=UPI0032C3F30A|nr:hypothetical protein MRS44_013952 [Fusarium solani]
MSAIDKILLLGATGYVGGTVLDHLIFNKEPNIKALTFDLLVRNKDATEKLRKAYGDRINPILWKGFTDTEFVADIAANYDIIVNTGTGFIAEGAKALVDGLARRARPGLREAWSASAGPLEETFGPEEQERVYTPSSTSFPHQLRSCVEALLRQQGDNRPLGQNWTSRFIKRHSKLSTKLGKRQESARFDGFTPRSVNWYFDIREDEYGWIKPENTVNVDEGGIMAGFGLDSLVIGSSDPKKKAMLKGSQSRRWTSFIEAVTATGRALKPGIIFKGKELQKQWCLDEFKLIADWYYITSPNGWTDNHIALEWLKDVYLPQTEPRDASDARLIILDGHGSHEQDEWMATCFLNNVYCCYLPAHCSHGLQPLDNGVFNVVKGAYRKELQMLASLTDSAPVDKVNFIRAYAKAREAGMKKEIILSGWMVTRNWPINRHKALSHPEIQPDREKLLEQLKTPSPPQLHSDDTPTTSRQVRDLAKHRSRPTRRKYSKIAKGVEALEMKVAVQNRRIASLEEQMAQLRRGKKRKAVANPNRRFMVLSEALASGETLGEPKEAETEVDVDEEVESVIEVGVGSEDESEDVTVTTKHCQRTRSGREVKNHAEKPPPRPLGPLAPYDYPRKSPPVAQQLAELKIDDTRHITIDTLPRLRIGAKTYVLYSWLWHRNKLRSSVVEHGHFLVEVIDNTAGDTFWLCKYYDARGRG